MNKWPGHWELIEHASELTASRVRSLSPRYIFFPHWSEKVPDEILELSECVCFHETDVPYGRGGSPLQNLILREHTSTQVTALRMTSELDAGPVYLKRPVDLHGSLLDIFLRVRERVADMIEKIIREEPCPQPQEGDVVMFGRRAPRESELSAAVEDSSKLYDFIRMLDAPGYPKAFLINSGWRLEFDQARQESDGTVTARVKFRHHNTQQKGRE